MGILDTIATDGSSPVGVGVKANGLMALYELGVEGANSAALGPRNRYFRGAVRAVADPVAGSGEARIYCDPVVLVYGEAFGGLENQRATPSFHSIRCRSRGPWAWPAGAAAGRMALLSGGRLAICCPSVTGDPAVQRPAAMSLGIFDPEAESLSFLSVPGAVGSTDDVVVATIDGTEHLVALSAGADPAIATFAPSGDSYAYDAAHSWTRAQLAASSAAGASLLPGGAGALTRIVAIPGSSFLVGLRPEPTTGQVGHLFLIDAATGTVLIDWTWPGPPPASGGTPRTVKPATLALWQPEDSLDPQVYVAVRYDAFVGAAADTYQPVQELLLDYEALTVTPTSVPFIPDTSAIPSIPVGLAYDPAGGLLVSTKQFRGAWVAGPLYLYMAAGDNTHAYSRSPNTPGATWWSSQYDTQVGADVQAAPGALAGGANAGQPVGSPYVDLLTGVALVGTLTPSAWPVLDETITLTTHTQLQADLSLIAANEAHQMAVVAVRGDYLRRRWWMVYAQTDPAAATAEVLRQFVLRWDMDELEADMALDIPARPASATGADSSDPLETLLDLGKNTGSSQINRVRAGAVTAQAVAGQVDDLVLAASWPGPALSGPQLLVATAKAGQVAPGSAAALQPHKPFLGAVTPNSAARLAALRRFLGNIAPASALAGRTARGFLATVAPGSALNRAAATTHRGEVDPSSGMFLGHRAAFEATVAPTSQAGSRYIGRQSFAGVVAPASMTARAVVRRFLGTVAPQGGLLRTSARAFSATVAPAGQLLPPVPVPRRLAEIIAVVGAPGGILKLLGAVPGIRRLVGAPKDTIRLPRS